MAPKVLSLDDLATLATAPSSTEFKTVTLPDGSTFRIGSLSALDVNEYLELRATSEGRRLGGALIISRSAVDADGVRTGVTKPYAQLGDDDKLKLAALQRLPFKVSETILRDIFVLNNMYGMTPATAAAALAEAKNG